MEDQILAFKFINGMEIIATIVSETDTRWELKNAMQFQYRQVNGPEGPGLQVSLVPASVVAKNPERGIDITVEKVALAFTFDVAENYLNYYKSEISGLVLAPASALAGLKK